MKFSKNSWERKTPAVNLPEQLILEMLDAPFPNQKLTFCEPLESGLANTKIRLKFEGLEQLFLLRVYTRNRNALDQEMLLSERFGKEVPMPEFVYTNKNFRGYSYAIQKWIEGKPLYEVFNNENALNLKAIAKEVAIVLSRIAGHTFKNGGFFKENLEVIPFEMGKNAMHPFVSYIQDCLFKGYVGKWIDQNLKDVVWKYVLENQSLFPALEPASLVHGDFNPDNILINEKTLTISAILDWEYAFSGSFLFDIGTALRFDVPSHYEKTFIEVYEAERNIKLPPEWRKMIKLQDLSNLVGLINTPHECPTMIRDIQTLISESINT